jgi:hypothetical protein
MTVVAFSAARDPRPTLIEVFCVQPYWRDRTKLVEGKLEQFSTLESAVRRGREAARKSPFVRVYRVRGNIEADYWEQPTTVASFGEMVAPF